MRKTKLYFKMEEVRKVVADAKRATPEQRELTFGQMLDGGVMIEVKPRPGEEESRHQKKLNRLKEKIGAGMHLVHDQGVYLMPNAHWEGISIAYARGCDPKDPNFYEVSRDLVGGSDFCEHVPIDILGGVLDDPRVTGFVITFSTTELEFGVTRKGLNSAYSDN